MTRTSAELTLSRFQLNFRGTFGSRPSSSEGRGPKLWPLASCDVVSMHFLRVGNMFGGTRAGKESCSMPSFITFCSHLGNMSFNQLCGRFLTFSLSAKCKVEWREAAQRMIDEERRQWAQWTDSGRFLFQGHLLYSYPLAFEITSVHDKAVRKNWMSSLLIALFFKLMEITTFHVGFRMF